MRAGTTIGELARELHLNPKTIRYYEEVGLLSKPRRSASGYRLYSGYETERLRLVMRAKLLGLSLAEIKELVEFAIDGHCNSLEQRLLSLVETKLGEIDQKLQDLITLKQELLHYKIDLSNKIALKTEEDNRLRSPSNCSCLSKVADDIKEDISNP